MFETTHCSSLIKTHDLDPSVLDTPLELFCQLLQHRIVLLQGFEKQGMRFIGYCERNPSYSRGRVGKCTSLVRGTKEENADGRSMEVGIIRMRGGEDEGLRSISCDLIRRDEDRLLTCFITRPPSECPMKIIGRLPSYLIISLTALLSSSD
jgi:hypothetical protein